MTDDVREYYDRLAGGEWDRLELPVQRIEFLSTLRLIDKYLPDGGRACDIGAGPGRYAVELIRRGFETTLIEPVDNLLELARAKLADEGLEAQALHVGDARRLDYLPDASFDVVLLMGPLYHLASRKDRMRALREASRILKRGGRGIVAYLNGWGLIKTGISDFPSRFENAASLSEMFGESGIAIWFWSNPEDASKEIEAAGLSVVTYAGAESFASGMDPLMAKLATEHPAGYENLVQAAVLTSESPQYRDATDHLHFVVEKT